MRRPNSPGISSHIRRLSLSAAFLPLLAVLPAKADPPSVVASIKPVHSLVAGVMGDLGTPHLLLTGASSPHTYAMKPSDAQALSDADAVFWIGPDLEKFLERPIENLGANAVVVALLDVPGMTVRDFPDDDDSDHEAHDDHDDDDHDEHAHDEPDGDDHDDHEDRDGHEEHGDEHADGHDHDHSRTDPHVWLDPENARAMVTAIADTLSEADPENADTYRKNAEAMDERLVDLEASVNSKLTPYKELPYYTFHEAFQYYDKRFGLNGQGSISIDPERQPGARQLAEIRETVGQFKKACVFAEPQFPPKLVNVVVEGTSAHSGVLDPLGASLEKGPDLYFELLDTNTDTFVACFKPMN